MQVDENDTLALCASLDDVLTRYLQTVQKYRTFRQQSCRHLKEGHWAIADTRHRLNNPLAIAHHDYAGRDISCTLQAAVATDSSGCVKLTADVVLPVNEDGTPKDTDTVATGTGLTANGVVRRRVFGSDKIQKPPGDSDDEDEKRSVPYETKMVGALSRGSDQARHADPARVADNAAAAAPEIDLSTQPLKWFGVLIPETLTKAQQHFRSSLVDLLEAASLDLQMQQLEREYAVLLARKKASASRS